MHQDLKEQLLLKISQTENQTLLEEISSLMEMQEPETLHQLNDVQKSAIQEARTELQQGRSCTDEEADKEIGKWLCE